MKTKTLALANGILGLVGGIFLLFGIWFILGVAATGVMTTFVYIVKIALLVLGIVGIAYYKGDERVGAAPSVLLIVGGAVSLTPFLGWIGGILAIIGGSLYLRTLKKFAKN
ncbi:hypothetical protein [Streptococcus gallinaceus]|uniref:Prophage Lp1 protein 6 n=1 Tax=Streptococcus gallinaceus TaxID=165758 RepID=A0ABV2JQ43_9STRE|nr:hypothetical protein [Streptococcus gallinaceus]MCP1639561.1 hypothetical protein [Streptococcus gallinaceus]MCP1770344.1 hypothetical protein [Streptococcus gallinaceus]